jgi:hypothetical protein
VAVKRPRVQLPYYPPQTNKEKETIMGTRNLTVVVLDGQYKVAQYGQWDGYPSGQGDTVCGFLQNVMDLEKFKSAVRECKFVTSDEIKAKWVECGADSKSNFVNLDVSEKFKQKYPQLSRDTAAEVLGLIQSGVARELQNSISFAGDSLFCEWAYVIDLDNEVLEVYKGFNKEPLDPTERFCNPMGITLEQGNKEYSPVRLYRKFPFKIATTFAMAKLSNLEYSEDADGNEIDNPKKACDYPDEYFVDGLADIEIEAPEVVNTFSVFLQALSEASDEDLIALRDYATEFFEADKNGLG